MGQGHYHPPAVISKSPSPCLICLPSSLVCLSTTCLSQPLPSLYSAIFPLQSLSWCRISPWNVDNSFPTPQPWCCSILQVPPAACFLHLVQASAISRVSIDSHIYKLVFLCLVFIMHSLLQVSKLVNHWWLQQIIFHLEVWLLPAEHGIKGPQHLFIFDPLDVFWGIKHYNLHLDCSQINSEQLAVWTLCIVGTKSNECRLIELYSSCSVHPIVS